ncbi:hypothetical protein [Bacillus sp. 3a]|uniref:hypothetical protein n=1 Tax=Bacillus sp. 3a TaxID=580459 RepID=UPI001F49C8D7|nr:hypothetical protein [Bacillus sp. 3a]
MNNWLKYKNEIDETRRELYGLNSYLKDLDALDRFSLQLKSDKLHLEIEEQKEIKVSVLEKALLKVITMTRIKCMSN